MQCPKINELAIELSQDVPGLKGYISNYNKACSQVEQNLTDNERQMYKAMLKEWSDKQLPPEMQQQYAHGNDSTRLKLADFSSLA